MRLGSCLFIALMAATHMLHAHGACMLRPVSLDDRLRESIVVVEGVVGSHACELLNDKIHTRWSISVARAWGMQRSAQRIDLVIEGGTLGDRKLVVVPNASVSEGDHVFLLLEPFDPSTFTYSLTTGPQGVLTFREHEVTDVVGGVYEAEALRTRISAMKGMSPQVTSLAAGLVPQLLRPRKQTESTQALTITNVSPSSITAGTLSTLTIKGTGFGAKGANSTVKFVSADEGGEVFGALPANHITSWNDTVIQVLVPCTATDDPTAGSGKVRVVTDAGDVLTSTQTITVTWAQFTSQNTAGGNVNQWTPVDLANDNGQNGYTFTLNAGLAANADATASIRRALSTWRCKAGANFAINPGTTNITCTNGNDGVNVISFDGVACQLPNGVLGVCYFYYANCVNGNVQYWRVDDIDLLMDGGTNWQYGPAAPTAPQIDFETVALHEIGHGLGLGHVRDNTAVMYWALGAGEQRRSLLAASDSAGSASIVARSATVRPCGIGAMVAVAAGVCNVAPPVAAFTASPVRGCAPLTVTFTNTSTNDPANSYWDVENDGTIDYTTTNATHVYTTPGTYTVRLRVTNAYGQNEVIKTSLVVVNAIPLVYAGKDDTVCLGTSKTIGGAPTASVTGPFVIRWRPGSVLNDSTIANPVATITSTTTFIVTATDANGCSKTDTMVLTLLPRPIVNTGADTTVCKGSAIQLNATVSSGLAPYEFSWQPTAGLNDPTIQKPTATPAVTTSYVLTVTDVRGCITADTIKITVNPLPVVDAGPDTVTICNGGSVRLTPTASSAATPLSYLWEPAAGLSSVNTPNPIASPTATQVYTLTVTDKNSCQKSDQIVVRVSDVPKPVITAPNGLKGCSGQGIVLDAGEGWQSYLWSNGATSRTITVTASGSYSVRVRNKFECEGTSAQSTVTINPTPQPAVTGPSQVCVNSQSVYAVATVAGDSYVWTVTNGTIRSGATSPTVTVQWNASGTGTIRCKQTSAAGCVGTSPTLSVTLGASLVPTITSSRSTDLCSGDTVILDAGVYATYAWSTGATTRTIAVTTAGSYTVRVTEPGGCSGTSAPTVVSVRPSPETPSIISSGNTLRSSVVAAAYQWFKGALPIAFATQSSYTVTDTGTYRVRVTSENGCTALSEPVRITTVDVADASAPQRVRIQPQPVFDKCTVLGLEGWQGGSMSIHDMHGVQRSGIIIEQAVSDMQLNVADLEAGVYTVMLRRAADVIYLRFVKL